MSIKCDTKKKPFCMSSGGPLPGGLETTREKGGEVVVVTVGGVGSGVAGGQEDRGDGLFGG